jgi:hypothetical protein
VAVAVLVATHLGLLILFDLTARPALTLALLYGGFAALAVAGWQLSRAAPGRLRWPHLLGVALLLRGLLLPLPPTLSNDILRYLWDGRVVASGHNPYLLAPEAEALHDLRDETWEAMHHHDVPTVYPPLAMALFTVAASVPGSSPVGVMVLKGLLSLADLLTCGLLVLLARRRRVPLHRVVWYAWNPLVVLEVAGMGHVDALGVAAVVAAVFYLHRPQEAARGAPRAVAASAAAACAGVLAKLAPLALIPLWSRASGRPLRYLGWVAAILTVTGLPVLWACGGIPPGLIRYGVSWEFNGFLFEPLWRLSEALGGQGAVEAVLNALKEATGHHPGWNRLYPYNYPQLHAKFLLAAGMGAAVLLSLRRPPGDGLTATGRLLGFLLLCSATIYPWYLLWVLPFAALGRWKSWLALSALLPLAYLPQLFGVPLWPWVYLAIWLPFVALALAGGRILPPREAPCTA